MDKIAYSSDQDRQQLFIETSANRSGLTPGIVEKDFWVCWILWKLFSSDEILKRIIFKGGTSLSKVYGLIERFSEDIDLILDWREVTDEDPLKKRSRTKQDKFNKAIIAESAVYLESRFYPIVSELLGPLCKTELIKENNHALKISYPALYSNRYLRPEILLETGPLAAWSPHENRSICSYAAEEFPDLFDVAKIDLKVTSVERTFWEKVTILHHEAHRPEENPMPKRYSRHYYDVYCMTQQKVKELALGNLSLMKEVVAFKDKFYPRGWARYDLAKLGTFKLVPPKHIWNALSRDYSDMKEMIYGNYPSFKDIMKTIEELELEINSL